MGLINSNGTRQRLHSTIPGPGATAARVKRLGASRDPEMLATLRVATELVPGGQAVKARWIHGLATGPRGSLDHTGSVGGSSGRTCGSRDPAGEPLKPPVRRSRVTTRKNPHRDRPETLPE